MPLIETMPCHVMHPSIVLYARCSGHGSEHTGPDALLMRRVVLGSGGSSASSLGDVFWLADNVPTGFDRYCR